MKEGAKDWATAMNDPRVFEKSSLSAVVHVTLLGTEVGCELVRAQIKVGLEWSSTQRDQEKAGRRLVV